MANLPISGLSAGVAITDANLFADVQAVGVGPTRVTALQLKQYIGNGLTLTNPLINGVITISGVAYTWPLTNGIAGSVLTNNGAGVLSWSSSVPGTVTSVGLDLSALGFTASGSPVTSAGTLTASGGTLNIAYGGTGATTASGALQNLLPPISASTTGYALFNDGFANYYWAAAGGGGGGGGGSVTSVSSIVSGLSFSNPTTTPVLNGILGTANGGTGLTALGVGVQSALANAVNTQNGILLAGVGGVLPIAQGGTSASTVLGAQANLLPAQATHANQFLKTDGAGNLSWSAVPGTGVSTINFATTGLTPNTATSGAVTVGGILVTANGGTGLDCSAAANGKILIGNGAGFSLNALTAGTGITIDNTVAGQITINSTVVAGVTTFSGGTTGLLPSAATAGAITLSGVLNVVNGGTGTATVPLNGQILIGNGTDYTVNTLTAGTGVSITNSAGAITIGATGSFSAGATGLTPAAATTGAVVLGGVLNVASGGTGLSAAGVAGTTIISDGTNYTTGYPNQATNITGGLANQILYQTAPSTTGFLPLGVTGTVLTGLTGGAPTWGVDYTTLGTTQCALGATNLTLAGLTTVTVTQDPVNPLELATKQYVDAVIAPINRIAPAACATTADLGPVPFSGLPIIDTYQVVAGDRVLVKSQTNSQEDGIYVAAAGNWTRATDLDTGPEFTSASVFVIDGSVNKNTSWIQLDTVATVDVDPQNWLQQSGLYNYVAGPGISIGVGNIINNIGVLSFDGGLTGLTPIGATTGAITLGGVLDLAYGGTSATTAFGARTNILPAYAGNAGRYLTVNALETDAVWTSALGASNYMDVTTSGTIQAAITGAGYVDAVGNVYVIYNSSAATVTLTAASLPNFPSFAGCTATDLVIYAGKTMVISTTSIAGAGTYSIDASNYSAGQAYNANVNASTTMAAVISGIGAADSKGTIYALHNTSGSAITINAGTVDNPSSLPGYLTGATFSIPANGVALVQTVTANASYDVISITNSVSTNLSGGTANVIPYQTAVNTTAFLPTGTAGQYLMSNGAASAPTWAPAAAAYYVDVTANGTVTSLLTGAGYTEAAGSIVVFYNSTTSAHTVTVPNWLNYLSFPNEATSTVLTIEPKQTIAIEVKTVATDYAIVSASGLLANAAITTVVSDSISNLLIANSVYEAEGLIVTLSNLAGSTVTITATTFNGFEGFAGVATSSTVKLAPQQSMTCIVTTVGSVYQLINVTDLRLQDVAVNAGPYNTAQNSAGHMVGDILVLRSGGSAVDITANSFVNAVSYPVQVTGGTTFRMQPNATLVLGLASTSANNWDIVSYKQPTTGDNLYMVVGANSTVSAAITGAGYVDAVGNQYTIYNNSVSSITLTTTTWDNAASYSTQISGTTLTLPAGQSVTIVTDAVGTNYSVVAFSTAGGSAAAVATFSATGTIASILSTASITEQAGKVVTLRNSGGSTVSITGTIQQFETYSPASSASAVLVQQNQEATFVIVTPGTTYALINLARVTYATTVNANTTLSTFITSMGLSFGDTVTITNTSTSSVTLTADVVGNTATYPAYSNATTITLPASGTVTLKLTSTTASNWSIISLDSPTGIGGSTAVAKVANGASQTAASGATTTLAFPTTVYDPNSWWNAGTNRFTPTIPGYYQVLANWGSQGPTGPANSYFQLYLMKNGLAFSHNLTAASSSPAFCEAAGLVYCNGTTDNLEVALYQQTGSTISSYPNSTFNNFQISLVSSTQAAPSLNAITVSGTSITSGNTGRVVYDNGGLFDELPAGTAGQVLTSTGSGTAPTWQTPASSSGLAASQYGADSVSLNFDNLQVTVLGASQGVNKGRTYIRTLSGTLNCAYAFHTWGATSTATQNTALALGTSNVDVGLALTGQTTMIIISELAASVYTGRSWQFFVRVGIGYNNNYITGQKMY